MLSNTILKVSINATEGDLLMIGSAGLLESLTAGMIHKKSPCVVEVGVRRAAISRYDARKSTLELITGNAITGIKM